MQGAVYIFSIEQNEIFGKLIVFSNEKITLKATLDFGPRIIHFSLKEHDNMFFEDKTKQGLGDVFEVYNGDIVKLYGGHRVWVSPEIMPTTYYPDNSPVDCITIDNKIILTAKAEKINNIQKIIEIEILDNNKVIVNNIIKNTGHFNIKIAPWAITMLASGGIEVLPQTKREAGFLANRFISVWSYTDMSDSRIKYGKDYITVKQDVKSTQPVKIGYNNENGYAVYFNKKQAFIKQFEYIPNGSYPDGGCNFETYTNESMLEMESLGQLKEVEPNKQLVLKEIWDIASFDKNIDITKEDELTNILNQIIK